MNDDQNPQLEQARTCNQTCAILFPDAVKAGQAFLEQENTKLNESASLQLLDLNDDFWALTLSNTVYVAQEAQFRQYNPQSGLYAPVPESTLISQIVSNLNLSATHFPPSLKFDSFLVLKNRARLKGVVERGKDLLSVENVFFQDRKHLHLSLSNGVLQIDNGQFHPSEAARPVKEALPVKYDPQAKCEMFLKMFLAHILEPPDIDLLQRYLSQILEGINHSQSILVLTGDAGWGKSSLMKIMGQIVGWSRVGIVREQLYRSDVELSHYAHKHLLYHPDMPTQFLNADQSSIFKRLVGADPIWAETKDNERIIIEGHFPLVLACNGKPEIKLDQDADAWARRLIVLNFKKPAHDKHFGKMAELLSEKEGSGVLNWLLEGRKKLVKDGLQLIVNPEQQTRTSLLLLGSESASAFVRSALVKKKGVEMGAVELYENYQEWCRKHQLLPFTSKRFHKIAKLELELSLGLRYRHDLVGVGGRAMRGWKGLGLVSEDAKNGSLKSGEQVVME